MRLLKLSQAGVILVVCSGFLLSACDNGDAPGPGSVPNVITGIVSAPSADSSAFVASVGIFDPLVTLASGFASTADAAVNGLVPVGGATVQLVRLNSQGQVSSVIASTTSSAGGGYVFTNTPAPDSTLEVRVTGQSAVMRAIVTGSEINISPASEAVVGGIVNALDGGVVINNFELEEVAALTNLVTGLDIDLTGKTFAQSVTAIQNACTPVLSNLITGFSAAGVVTVLHNGLYSGMQFESALNDTFTLGAGEGGIEIRSFIGGWGYGDSGLISGGNIFGTLTRHNLTTVEAPISAQFSENGVWNVVAADGQVVTMNPEGSTTMGAVTNNGSLMVFPVETDATGVLGRGVMLAVRRNVGSTTETPVLDNTILDPVGSPGTVYNLVQLKETLSGVLSDLGQNLAAVTTETGTLTFNSDDAIEFPGSEENLYAALSGAVNTTHRLALDLDSDTIAASSPSVEPIAGRYTVAPDGSVIMNNDDGTSLAKGYVTGDGKVLALTSTTDLIQINLNVLANDSDADAGDTLTITEVTTPVLGGSVTINTAGNQLLYIPPNNVNSGTEQFTYSVGSGAAKRTGAVSIALTTTNTAPVANPDQFNVAINSSANSLDVLANDSDINIGQKLTISTATVTTKLGGGGHVSINSAGNRLVYTPPTNSTGLEVLTYTITDGIVDPPVTSTVTVMTVLASTGNSAPTAVDDSGTNVAMNSSLNVLDVLANDTDPDAGNSLTITQVGATNHGGTVTRTADISGPNRLLSYTPAPDYSGTETFTYTVSDEVATDTASVTVTVIGVGNTVPEAEDDVGVIVQSSINNVLDVLANDHDDDVGTALTITQVDATNAHGSVTISGAGPNNTLLYAPTDPYQGSASFTYTISDGAATDTATVTLTVVGSPYTTSSIAVDDVDYHLGENSSGNLLPVLANDNGLGGGLTIFAASITTPLGSGGIVTVNGTSDRLIYTPPAGASGTEVLSYTVKRDSTLTDTGSVTVTVMPSNAAPVANDDSSINITVDTTGNDLDVLANDTDPDVGDALTITQKDDTNAHGTVTINGAGPNNTLLYSPTAAYQGPASFTYTISDGIATDTATVTLTVGNAAPAAANDGFNVAVDLVPNTLDVLANDSDADVPVQTLTISAADLTSAQGGTVTNNGSNLSYTPSPAAVLAGTDSFGYTVSDDITTTSATVTVTVGANLAPNPAGDVFTVLENSSGNALAVLANDSDIDVPAQPLTITAASVTTPLGVGGNVSINGTSDGLLYTPVAATTGTEVLTYTVDDGVTATSASVTVTVEANVAPTAGDDSYRVDKNSNGNALNVLANDSDSNVPAQTLTISAADTASAQGGTVSINGTNDGLVYAPASGFSGTDTFSYTVTDNSTPPLTDTATVTVTVGAPANTPPVAQDDDNNLNTSGFTVDLGSSNNPLDVLANDSDADVGDTLTITQVGVTNHGGVVTINGSNNGLIYTPAPGYSGAETFTYTVTDGKDPVSADVVVTVLGIGNTAPSANTDNGMRVRTNSSNNALDVLANDSDADVGDALTITQVSVPDHGGVVTINGTSDGLIYTPASGYVGTEVFTYTVSDGTDTASAGVTMNVVTANAAPVAVNDAGYLVLSGSGDNVFNVLTNDFDLDVGDVLTITLVDSNPGSASSATTAPTQKGGTVDNNGSSVSYTPAPNFTGTDSFIYTLSDGTDTDTAVVTVSVVAGNTPPIAVDDDYRIAKDSSNNSLNVLVNDSDIDVSDTLTITQVSSALHGSVVRNGSNNGLIYTPAPGYNGPDPDTFTYTVSDGYSTAVAAVTVTVTDANAPPDVNADTSWSYVVQSEEDRTTNLANREIGMAIRRASGLNNSILSGSTYNVVQHASYFTSSGSEVAAESGYKSGTISFSGGGVISGSLLGKRASLDIEAARSGLTSALTTSASATETISSGSFSVNSDGTMTLAFSIGAATVFGNGAVSSDGEVIAVAVRVTEGGDDTGRGLLFLVRQP